MKIKSKNVAYLAILAAAMPLAGNVARADNQVQLAQSGYNYSDGGEFSAIISPTDPTLNPYLGNYVASTLVDNGFQTFCVETGVEFNPSSSYYYQIANYTPGTSTEAHYTPGTSVNGGGPLTGSGLNLTEGAAWLYAMFAGGHLAGYDYQNSGSGTSLPGPNSTRKTDAGYLQAAIWALQGGQSIAGFNPDNNLSDNIYYQAVLNQFGTLSSAETAAPTGGYDNVEILQLWSGVGGTGTSYQNQLVLVGPPPSPTPDGGMTVILLGGALAGVYALRRKLAA